MPEVPPPPDNSRFPIFGVRGWERAEEGGEGMEIEVYARRVAARRTMPSKEGRNYSGSPSYIDRMQLADL